MQRVTAVPGLLLVTLLYIGWPPSLDVSTTVPARNSLFEFVVELENAEKTPKEATAPTAPTTSMVRSALRVREVWVMGPSKGAAAHRERPCRADLSALIGHWSNAL